MEIDRTFARVHLDNLSHNYKEAKQKVGDALVCCVVKADAYGHGAVKCARRLASDGCKVFAVACLKEAIELREAGVNEDIIIFGRTKFINACYLEKYNLIQTVYSYEYAKELAKCNKTIRIHINIDTGMSRFGLYLQNKSDLSKVVEDIKNIQSLKSLKYEGLYTHFANSDEETVEFCNHQFDLYKSLIDELNYQNIPAGIKHVANSGAIVSHPDKYLDMVRFGIGLYGYPHTRNNNTLNPVMELFSTVTSSRTIEQGITVSYGRTFTAKEKMRIATVAIGYADGYNRSLSNKDYLVYKNKKLPVIGRVCMDAIMIDLKGEDIKDGELVEVFGFNKPLESMCEILNTIPYELLCNVSKRVTRLYV